MCLTNLILIQFSQSSDGREAKSDRFPIDNRGARFLMNYPDCGMMRTIASRWNFRRIKTHRTIAGQVASRGYASEILIYNFEP
ncbi:hypothetical protein [Bradyrhizobium sp. USDA 4506]